jgi:hypothetical protein
MEDEVPAEMGDECVAKTEDKIKEKKAKPKQSVRTARTMRTLLAIKKKAKIPVSRQPIARKGGLHIMYKELLLMICRAFKVIEAMRISDDLPPEKVLLDMMNCVKAWLLGRKAKNFSARRRQYLLLRWQKFQDKFLKIVCLEPPQPQKPPHLIPTPPPDVSSLDQE